MPLLCEGRNEYLHGSQNFETKKDGGHGQISQDRSQMSRSDECLQVATLEPGMPECWREYNELSRANQLRDLESEMEGGREQDNQPDKGQDENGSEKQKDQEKKAPEIPEIGFMEITNDDGEKDIIMTQEYFAAAASIYQMTRDPRHLYVTRRSIIDQEARFNDELFPPEFMKPIDEAEWDK